MLSTSIVLALLGCGSAPVDPASTPAGKLCGRAYSSTIDSLEDVANQRGVDMPEVATKQEYIAKCVELGFTDAQLKCLDPKLATGDEACAASLKETEEKRGKLNGILVKKGGAPEPAPAEPAPAPAEPAPAEPAPVTP